MGNYDENDDHSLRTYIICIITMVIITIFFIIYISLTARRLRRKIAKMGRLIPAVYAVIVPGPIATVQASYQQQYLNYGQLPSQIEQPSCPPPPQPGWCPPEAPPAYSTIIKD